MPKISCIIPVYNGEKYIEKCARSIFEQTLDDMEFLFINDCTPDKSMEVLARVMEDYPARKSQIRIINLPTNHQLAAVRNIAFDNARGEYGFFIDPDDWIDKDLCEKWYQTAKDTGADIVQCDYALEKYDGTEYVKVKPFMRAIDILKYDRFYALSFSFHLIKTDKIKESEIRCFPGLNNCEDRGFLGRFFTLPLSVAHIDGPVYHYFKMNPQSVTTNIQEEQDKLKHQECLKLLKEYYDEHDIPLSEMSVIIRWMRDQKNSYMQRGSLRRWLALFPEVCDWECSQPESSTIYKTVYRLSHRLHSTVPMSLYLSLNRLLRH